MKLKVELLKRLAEREDANELVARALGVCPTCGQEMPTVPDKRRRTRASSKRAQIVEWHAQNPKGSQNACAKALGLSQTYVGKVFHEEDANGHG